MVRRIQALNYGCLRHVDVRLEGNFHILVGPNASGKSTLIDVIVFLADATIGNIEKVVQQCVPDFRDLVWCKCDRIKQLLPLFLTLKLVLERLRSSKSLGLRNAFQRHHL